MTDEPMLRIRDVARRLNVAPKTVRRYIATGQLSATKLTTGHWRVPESAVRAFAQGSASNGVGER
jgi:excisionase family DNA binding protein